MPRPFRIFIGPQNILHVVNRATVARWVFRIVRPSQRVIANILAYPIQLILIANDVLVIILLPDLYGHAMACPYQEAMQIL